MDLNFRIRAEVTDHEYKSFHHTFDGPVFWQAFASRLETNRTFKKAALTVYKAHLLFPPINVKFMFLNVIIKVKNSTGLFF